MEQHLQELRQKQRKLTFLLGEKIENLYTSGLLRFLYTSDGVKDEEEVLKLLRLLGYIEERIAKLSHFYGEDELGSDTLAQEAEEKEETEGVVKK